jgi:hypothetical protein
MKNRFRSVHLGIAVGVMSLAAPVFAGDPPAATQTGAVRDPDGPAVGCAKGSENEGFFARLKESYKTHQAWDGGDPNTSHTRFNYTNGTGGNFPAAYSFEPNTVQLDQAALYIERTPDEIQGIISIGGVVSPGYTVPITSTRSATASSATNT